jgi:hypothetical protein
MAKKAPVVFRTKLGAAKKVARSRIWIEGQRLVDAGFTVGSYFAKTYFSAKVCGKVQPGGLTLHLLKMEDVLSGAPCKVSGKGEKPIIDITGELVREHFGTFGTHVDVTFEKGTITIRPAAD